MKVRNIVRKAAVLGSSVALVGSTLMGALAYDLGDFPDRYIVDGQFDGKIVVGERAATADVLGSIDIAAALQAASVSEEDVEIPGGQGGVSLTGDAFQIETSSDLLEIRETLGEVFDTLTASELEALEGGSITTDEGSTEYFQYLRFGEDGNSDSLQEMAVNYAEDEDEVLGDFLVIDTGSDIFEWEIEFTEGLESEIDTAPNPDELDDLEDETFNIFGTEFTFVDSAINTGLLDVTISFMAGEVGDTLREGETRTYSIDGVDYEITLVFVSDPNSQDDAEAKFSVNGELTDSMKDGQTDTLSGGLQIGVRDLLVNSREGVVSFFLGADKVEFTDGDFTDSTNGGTVEIGDENIEDASVEIIGNTLGSDSFEITNIKYRLEGDASVGSTLYLPPGQGLRQFLDEPEGMLSPTFDVTYEGLYDVATTPIDIDASSDDEYDITATNLRGKTYSWPLISTDATFKWGDDDDDFWFLEPPAVDMTNVSDTVPGDFWITDDDFFLLSENPVGSASEKDDSAVLSYDDIDTSERILYFNDEATGETRSVSYTTDTTNLEVLGTATNLVVEGNSYNVWVYNDTGGSPTYPIAVDLDGDGTLDGDQVGFTVKGGATLNFDDEGTSQDVADGAVNGLGKVNMTLATPSDQFDDSTLGGDSLNWTISEADAETLSLGSVAYNGPLVGTDKWDEFNLVNDDNDDDYERGMTDYGAFVELHDPSGSNDAEELSIQFPEAQRGAQVFVIAGTVERGASGGSSVSADVVNPIAVGLAVLDVNAPPLGDENLIIVGGPCANSVAAAFLDNPENCAEGFEPGKAVISAKEFGDTVSTLVAGYEAQETQGGSRVLAAYEDYALSGSEVEVVVADLNSITVNPVSADEPMDDEPMDDEPADDEPAE